MNVARRQTIAGGNSPARASKPGNARTTSEGPSRASQYRWDRMLELFALPTALGALQRRLEIRELEAAGPTAS